MKKYIVIYYAPKSAVDQMSNATPEEAKKSMEPWMAWMNKIGSAMVDMGTPLGNAQKVTKSGTTKSDSKIVGYTILQAENMDEGVKLIQGHPHLAFGEGCEVEIHECMPLPGM